MAFYAQCNLALQDCNALWPRSTSDVAPFTNQSCVQDVRLTGSIGRCGWTGAPCTVNGTISNCVWPYAEVCQNGVCAGGVGQPCIPFGDRYTCNAPIYCNVTIGHGPNAICGGAGAQVNINDKPKGLDFARDYCVSGQASQVNPDYWRCDPGDAHIPITPTSTNTPSSSKTTAASLNSSPADNNSTSSTRSKKSLVGPIVGGAVVGVLFIAFILAFFWYRRRERTRRRFRVDAYDPTEDSSQEPASLLHRRQMSEQSRITATSESHKSPLPQMRSAVAAIAGGGAGSSGKLDPLLNGSVAPPSTGSGTDSSVIHTPQSHALNRPILHRSPSDPVPGSPYVASSLSLSQETQYVTRPARARTRLKSSGSTSSRPGTRGNSLPRSPESQPVSTDDVEQRLLELRDEAERGLAEIRANRTGSEDAEMPPPYATAV